MNEKDGFDCGASTFAYVTGVVRGEFGHLYARMRNLLPQHSFSLRPELEVSSQVSCMRSMGEEKARVYALRFGLTGESLSMHEVDAGLKVMRRMDRRMKKIAEKEGELDYEPTWADFTLRHIIASGVEWVLFWHDYDPRRTPPNLDSMGRISTRHIDRIAERLHAMERSMIAHMSPI